MNGKAKLLLTSILFAALALGCSEQIEDYPDAAEITPVDDGLGIERSAMPDTVPDMPGYKGRIYRDGRIVLAGQPDEDALRALPDHGVTCVVNLRTPKEMADREKIPFDEAVLVEELGMEYVRIPLGGKDHPYTPAAVDTFAAAFERHDGHVLMHCTVAGRASYLWAAYLIRHQGWSLDDAYAQGREVGISAVPLDGLLDRRLKLMFVE